MVMAYPLEAILGEMPRWIRAYESPRRDRIEALAYDFKILRIYLKCTELWKDPGQAVFPASRIEDALQETWLDLEYAAYSVPGYFITEGVDKFISHAKEKIELFKPEIIKAYSILSTESWQSKHPHVFCYNLRGLTEDVVENMKNLLESKNLQLEIQVLKKKQMETILEKLRVLFNFLDYRIKWDLRDSPSFDVFLRDVAINAAYLLHLYWIGEGEEETSEMEVQISHLLEKMKPHTPDAIEMYLAVLKTSKWKGAVDGSIRDLVSSFANFVLANSMVSTIDQVAAIQEVLIFLITFLLHQPNDCREDWKTIVTEIKSAILEAGSFDYSMNIKPEMTEEMTREMAIQLSWFLEKMKCIRAEVLLVRLLHQEDNVLVSLMDKLPILHKYLKFFNNIFSNMKEIAEDGNLLLAHATTVAREVTSFIDNVHDDKMTQEMAFRMNFQLSMLVEKTKLTKADMTLMEMKKRKANSSVSVDDKIDNLHEGLRFLGKFLMDSAEIEPSTEDRELFLTHLKAVVTESSSLTETYCANDFREDTDTGTGLLLTNLLQKISLMKSEVLLMELQDREFGLIFHMKNEIQTLHAELSFLRTFLMDQTKEDNKDGKSILTQSTALVDEVASLVCSLYEKTCDEEMGTELKVLILELLEKIKLVKSDIRKIYLQIPMSSQFNVPKTDVIGFINFLVGDLAELPNSKLNSIASAKHHIEMMRSELKFFSNFLNDIAERQNEHEKLRDLWTVIRDIAYEVEYVTDLFLVGDKPVWYLLLWLSHAMEEIKLIKANVTEIYDKKSYGIGAQSMSEDSYHVPVQASSTPVIDEVVVGVRDEAEKIIDRLTRGTMQLDIVPIVGMPGLGKTTLAKNVYNDPSVSHHFHIRAWCCVSQVYHKRDLLLDILGDVMELTDKIHKMSDDDIALELYKCLKGRRYLIVMDDLWDKRAWDDLRESFPDDGKRSRILFTSRINDVALQAKPGIIPHPLRLLRDQESWELLQAKLPQKEGLQPELVEIGIRIAKNCRGLPLAVVVIAGLLAKTERKLDWWKKIAENLSSHIVGDPDKKCMHILELSYEHLPDHLKSCFLYFGSFPEDKEIPVWKLQWLWTAEGFLPKTESKSLEDVAEDCLLNLIDRSLVMVSKRRSSGGVKACRVHDLLRDLCVEKAKKDNFFQQINGYDEFFPSSPSDLNFNVESDNSGPPNPVIYQQRRLCIISKRKHFASLKPCGPRVHSLLFFPSGDENSKFTHDVSFISDNFKLLRVLDLESINMGSSFPTGIELLVRLRYLSVRGNIKSIPPSIVRLRNLETLLVKGLRGEVELPDAFWKMRSLRHVHINNRFAFRLRDNKLDSSWLLDGIETLSSPALYGKDADEILRRLPRLRKLRCILLDKFPVFNFGDRFPVLDFLTRLESLKIAYHGKISAPSKFHFPMNLKKLTLSKFQLPWNEISTIGRLPNLEVLKLLFTSFEGQIWNMREGEFLKLKFLKLEGLNISQWNASEDLIPCLERLVLRGCKQLEAIPSRFGDIPALEMIEVHWCSQAAATSVRRIQEEQQDIGNEELNVLIYPSDSGNRSCS